MRSRGRRRRFRRCGARPHAEVTTAVLVEDIDVHRERFGVEPICVVLSKAGTKIAPSCYYAAKNRAPSARNSRCPAPGGDPSGPCRELRRLRGPQGPRGDEPAWPPDRAVHGAPADAYRGAARDQPSQRAMHHDPGAGPDSRPDLLDRDFAPPAPNRVWVASTPIAGPSPGGSTRRSSSTSTPAAWSAGSCRRACAPSSP